MYNQRGTSQHYLPHAQPLKGLNYSNCQKSTALNFSDFSDILIAGESINPNCMYTRPRN